MGKSKVCAFCGRKIARGKPYYRNDENGEVYHKKCYASRKSGTKNRGVKTRKNNVPLEPDFGAKRNATLPTVKTPPPPGYVPEVTDVDTPDLAVGDDPVERTPRPNRESTQNPAASEGGSAYYSHTYENPNIPTALKKLRSVR